MITRFLMNISFAAALAAAIAIPAAIADDRGTGGSGVPASGYTKQVLSQDRATVSSHALAAERAANGSNQSDWCKGNRGTGGSGMPAHLYGRC